MVSPQRGALEVPQLVYFTVFGARRLSAHFGCQKVSTVQRFRNVHFYGEAVFINLWFVCLWLLFWMTWRLHVPKTGPRVAFLLAMGSTCTF